MPCHILWNANPVDSDMVIKRLSFIGVLVSVQYRLISTRVGLDTSYD